MVEDTTGWRWTHGLGAGLFVAATLMVFVGLRLLLTAPVAPLGPLHFDLPADRLLPPTPEDLGVETSGLDDMPSPITSSEIIHVERGEGSARVVALLRMGDGPEDVHLLELDVSGDDLRTEVIEEAVAGVASGEPTEEHPPVDRVGYASGWGLTLPCPPLRH